MASHAVDIIKRKWHGITNQNQAAKALQHGTNAQKAPTKNAHTAAAVAARSCGFLPQRSSKE
jgi:hypothetical protein